MKELFAKVIVKIKVAPFYGPWCTNDSGGLTCHREASVYMKRVAYNTLVRVCLPSCVFTEGAAIIWRLALSS